MSELAFDEPECTKQIFDYIKFGSALVFAGLALRRYVKCHDFLMTIFIMVTLLCSCRFSGSMSFLLLFLAARATWDCDFYKIVKIDVIVRSVITVLLGCFSFLGIMKNYSLSINGNFKRAMGFGHPNTFGLMLAVIFVELLYLYYEQIQLIGIFLFIYVLYRLYQFGISRTAIILMGVEIVLCICLRFQWMKRLVLSTSGKGVLLFLPSIVCAGCYFMAMKFTRNSVFWMVLDALLTTRVYWANDYLKKYGVSLFGQSITPMTSRNATLLGIDASSSFDMAYVRIGVQYGMLMLIFYLSILTVVQAKALKEQNWGLLLANIFFVLLGIVENLPFSIGINVFLLYAFQEREGKHSESAIA